MKTKNVATFFAVFAAALYAINIPFSKILLQFVSPTMMAAFLYLGAGFGLLLYGFVAKEREKGAPLARAELPYTIGGGIGQSRLCMLMMGCAHIGEVQCSIWDKDTMDGCKAAGIRLL